MENDPKASGNGKIAKVLKIIGITLVILVGLMIAGVYSLRTMLNGEIGRESYNGSGGMMDMESSMRTSLEQKMPSPTSAPSSLEGSFSAPVMKSVGNSGSSSSPDSFIPTEQVTVDKKVIKNGDMSLKVDNVDKALEEITGVARNNGGEVFSSNVYQNGKNIKTGYATVKVPVANFEKTYNELKKVATLVVRESTSGMDVTDQYVDLEAQLKNKQAEEQAFQKIMDQAQKIDDILAVQQQLSRVRGEIERLQGRLKLMNSQTDNATISINLSEDAEIAITDRWRPGQVAKEAINTLVKKVQNFIDFVIELVVTIIPVLVLYGLLVWILYILGRKIYRRLRKKEQI